MIRWLGFSAIAVALVGCGNDRVEHGTAELREANSGAACGEGDVGGEVGDQAEDFALQSQDGRTVLLSDYCGQVVLLQLGAMWCPSCQLEAEAIPELLEKYSAQNLVILNLLSEDPRFDPITEEGLKSWADAFDLESPVLADTDWEVWYRYYDRLATPRAVLIDEEGTILKNDFVVRERDLDDAFGL